MRPRSWWLVCLAAVAAAVVPLPATFVERWYSRGVYPHIQGALTRASNLVPFSIFDVLCVAAVVLTALTVCRRVRRAGFVRGGWQTLVLLARAVAIVYLVFLATWGLNYRRVPLLEKVRFERARVTREAAAAMTRQAVAQVNRLYADAHRHPASVAALVSPFHSAQRALAPTPPIVPGRPKPTLLGGYFHQTAISGMTDPFLLETTIAPDLLDVERPFVIAHEWAHLAGYADESEANFVAWLACLRGDPVAQYSAWLAMLAYLPADRAAAQALGPGPRLDLFAISYRYAHTSPFLRAAARTGYDKYLKANRVEAGVASYDLVVLLVLGTPMDSAGNPALR